MDALPGQLDLRNLLNLDQVNSIRVDKEPRSSSPVPYPTPKFSLQADRVFQELLRRLAAQVLRQFYHTRLSLSIKDSILHATECGTGGASSSSCSLRNNRDDSLSRIDFAG
jgi:hypothetical protein